jgi:mannose-6-phosphate isomerase-like protein (cupin superfamily)
MGASEGVDVYTPKNVDAMSQKLAQKRTQFASQDLVKYGNHYTMLAYRDATGASEVHEHEADFFVVESGEATLVTGGKVVNPKTTKPGEIRGSSIEGGEKRQVAKGDIVHIPAGTPHQLLIPNGSSFTYFVIKVTGQ